MERDQVEMEREQLGLEAERDAIDEGAVRAKAGRKDSTQRSERGEEAATAAEHELAACREQCAKAERKTADVLAEGKAESRAESRMAALEMR